MKSAIYMDGKRFEETEFKLEEDFEKVVKQNSKTLFGPKSIYFDVKSKIETKTLGGAIPDGFLFDFKNKDNPKFYLVEVELQKHPFDGHIFPQIKKFFSFFKNSKSRDDLINKIFNHVKTNRELEKEFIKFVGEKEIFKTIKDIIENSQNILLIIDEYKPEFDETSETITEWAKLVKIEVLKEYTAERKTIFVMNPDFEDIDFVQTVASDDETIEYNENYHLSYANETIISIYSDLKTHMNRLDSQIMINPKKYYISLRKNRNFAFISVTKKKMHIIIMIPMTTGAKLIKHVNLIALPNSVQDFYNGPCFQVTLEKAEELQDVIPALIEAYKSQNN